MSQLAPDARKLVATTGANVWYPAITDEELDNEQLLMSKYRKQMGMTRVAFGILGLVGVGLLVNYLKGE